MLHDGGYASFQSLLANISAAQHSAHSASIQPPPLHPADYMNSNATASPPLSPVISATTIAANSNGGGSSSPPNDLRSSSIANLRLKAREHELRLEMLRQNPNSDIIS